VSSLLADALRDRYVIEHDLGRGGMAVIYLAHDLKHDRFVALKVLRSGLAASLGPDRFLREIRLTAQLEHPHILRLLDSGNAGGQLWYTMPYIEGETLRERLSREVQLPVREAVRIAREVAQALHYAHQQGIVHRDIKPENVLLSGGYPLVADFGVAKALGQAAAHRLTETGLVVGTAAYMSPEQAAAGPVDARTDIYSLGCVLYEMLAGEIPFAEATGQAMIARRLAGPPRSLRILRPDVPPAVDAAMQRALAPAPSARYASAGELAGALADPVDATPQEGPPDEELPAKGAGRFALVVLAVLAALLMLLAAWAFTAV
jgi:serine/threonine-protein kinase